MRRIGIDVGGTNTDAVLLVDGKVVQGIKARDNRGRHGRHRRGLPGAREGALT